MTTQSPVLGVADGHPRLDFLIREPAPEDLDALAELINAASRASSVLPRTREAIAAAMSGFLVALRGGELIGCGGLQRMSPTLVELRSLVVADGRRGGGVGSALTAELAAKARRAGYSRLFTLTDNPRFFERLGFARTEFETLPEKVWSDCRLCPKLNNCGETALDFDLSRA